MSSLRSPSQLHKVYAHLHIFDAMDKNISDPHKSLIFALIAFSPLWPDCEERSGSDLDQGDRRAIQYVVDLVQAPSAGKPFRSRSW